jgi:hypothetical protein
MEDVGIFYVHFVYFTAIWYIFRLFGIYFPVLVCCSKKNLATLIRSQCRQGSPFSAIFVHFWKKFALFLKTNVMIQF